MTSLYTSALLFALTAAPQPTLFDDPVSFRRVYKKGDVEVVKTVSRYETSSVTDMMGEQEKSESVQESVLESRYEIQSVAEDGTASFTALFKTISLKMTAGGEEVDNEPEDTEDESGEGKIDPLGRLIEFEYKGREKDEEEVGDPFDALSNFDLEDFTYFPSKPVRPGDTWDLKPKKDSIFDSDSIIIGKFVGLEEWKGKPAFRLEFSGAPKIEIDVAKMMGDEKPPFEMLMKGSANFKTTKWIEPGTFITVRALSVFDMSVNMDVKDIDLKLTVRTKGTDESELKR